MSTVTDRLSLAIWLKRPEQTNRVRHFRRLLQLFPFSQREQPQSTVSVLAVAAVEPPVAEWPVNGPVDIDEVFKMFDEFRGRDTAYQIESWWDVWQVDQDWELRPARVLLSCFEPGFESHANTSGGPQEDIRIDFGVDSHYLPESDTAGSARMIQSNIRSLLRLVHEIDDQLPVAERRLETESGENFAERLQQQLLGTAAHRTQ